MGSAKIIKLFDNEVDFIDDLSNIVLWSNSENILDIIISNLELIFWDGFCIVIYSDFELIFWHIFIQVPIWHVQFLFPVVHFQYPRLIVPKEHLLF